MKKLITLILISIVCFSLMSCSSAAPPEFVEIDTLLDALDNQAKAELNIGKATTLFVKVTVIASDHCVVAHLFNSESSKVYMEKEILAELDKDQYAAIYGVVESVASNENNTSFHYVFKDGRIEDMALVDEYVAKMNYGFTSHNNDHIYERKTFLIDYVNARGEALALDENEIREYIIGTWERKIKQAFTDYFGEITFYGTHTPEITFFEDGTYSIETYDNNTSTSDFYSGNYEIEDGAWFIEGDRVKIDCFSYVSLLGERIYKISENVFIYGDEYIFIRRK